MIDKMQRKWKNTKQQLRDGSNIPSQSQVFMKSGDSKMLSY